MPSDGCPSAWREGLHGTAGSLAFVFAATFSLDGGSESRALHDLLAFFAGERVRDLQRKTFLWLADVRARRRLLISSLDWDRGIPNVRMLQGRFLVYKI